MVIEKKSINQISPLLPRFNMSISAVSNPTGYQENFNPNNPYGDFYNTQAFGANLDQTNALSIQQSEEANERSQQDINQAFNSDSQTPVFI